MQVRQQRRHQGGFTLVEMAVVLVIIGVILGAVMIGRDVQRNAEYTRIKQKFVDQWVVAYNNYHQRYGAPIGDNQSAPRLMVNGTNYGGDGTFLSGGDMSSAQPPAALCGAQTGAGRNGVLTAITNRQVQGDDNFNLRVMMRRAGITMPPGRGDGMEDRYVYLDTNGNPQEVQVCFQWNPPGTDSGSGNVMVITGLTPDLARALDQAFDGKPDAQAGAFRQAPITRDAGGAGTNNPGVEWIGNNTQSYASGTGNATTDGGNTDTEQVLTLVAHLKLNQ